MKLAYAQAEKTGTDWGEMLHVAFDFGLPQRVNIEWSIQKAGSDEWGGPW